jgi:hypothetical protein
MQAIVAVVAAVVATVWWIHRGGWQANASTVDPRHLGNLLLPFLVLLCVAGAFRALPRRRNLQLALEKDYGLVAPASTVWLWQSAYTIALGGAILGGNFTSTHNDVFGSVLRWVGMAAGITCVVIGSGLAAVSLLWPGQIALTPEGIQFTRGTKTVVAKWAALEPHAPALPRAGLAGTIDLAVAHPEHIRGARPGADGCIGLPAHGYFVNPRVLTATIGHYLTNPAHRDSLGTQADYDRLGAELRSGTGAVGLGR